MRVFQWIVTGLLVLNVSAAVAQKKKGIAQELSGQGYGDAGCGLGSVVFGDQPGAVQIVAATLNGTSGNQTFGITSGTSNCGGLSHSAKVEQFIDVNKVALVNDLARGNGETVASLSELMGCKNHDFSQNMKQSYFKNFSNKDASIQDLQDTAVKACQI